MKKRSEEGPYEAGRNSETSSDHRPSKKAKASHTFDGEVDIADSSNKDHARKANTKPSNGRNKNGKITTAGRGGTRKEGSKDVKTEGKALHEQSDLSEISETEDGGTETEDSEGNSNLICQGTHC